MPFGKNIFFVAALLPLTLQQAASFSYDSVIIAFAFYYLALCMHLVYTAEKIRIWDIVALVIYLAVFCAPKAGVYIVLFALLPIVSYSCRFPAKGYYEFSHGGDGGHQRVVYCRRIKSHTVIFRIN